MKIQWTKERSDLMKLANSLKGVSFYHVHPKIVQESLGHASIQITLGTYGHVAPGLQEAAATSLNKMILAKFEKEAI